MVISSLGCSISICIDIVSSVIIFLYNTLMIHLQPLQLEGISTRGDSEDEIASYIQADDGFVRNRVSQSYSDSLDMRQSQIEKELMEAKVIIEAMEAEQFHLIKELQHTQEENYGLKEMLKKTDYVKGQPPHQHSNKSLGLVAIEKKSMVGMMESEDGERKTMKDRLDRILHELEEVKSRNNQYEQERASQQSRQEQVELVFEQVESETSRTILQLQEEVATLQLELHDKLTVASNENLRLREALEAQQVEMRILGADWEKATLELTNFLLDGSRSLEDVSRQIASIAGLFPQANACIGENVEKAAVTCIEKEERILLLQRSLEDAQNTVFEMDQKLSSLKGATIALSEFQHLTSEGISRETFDSNMQLQEKISVIRMQKDQIAEAENRAYAAFLVIKWLSDHHEVVQRKGITERVGPSTLVCSTENISQGIPKMKADVDALSAEQLAQIKMASPGASESKKAFDECNGETEIFILAPQAVASNKYGLCSDLICGMKREASDMSTEFGELRNHGVVTSLSWKDRSFLKIENGSQVLHQIKDDLREINCRLTAIKSCLDMKFGCKSVDEWSSSCYTSGSDSENIATECESSDLENACSSMSEPVRQLKGSELPSQIYSESHNSETGLIKPLHIPCCNNSRVCLRKELDNAFIMFYKQYVRLSTIFSGVVKGSSPFCSGNSFRLVSLCRIYP